MDIHKNKGKKIFVVALALILIFQTFFNLDIFHKRIEVKGANHQLAAGDWLYIDTSGFVKWEEAGAATFLYVIGGDKNGQSIPAEAVKGETHLYRVKLPEGITNFVLRRINPNRINEDLTKDTSWGNDIGWGQAPATDSNVQISTAYANGTNVYRILGIGTAGSWGSNWLSFTKEGETVYFKNMNPATTISSEFKAEFYDSTGTLGEADRTKTVSMTQDTTYGNKYSVVVPNDVNNVAYDKVRFINGTDVLADVALVHGAYNETSTNTYYYGRTIKNNSSIISGFDNAYDENGSISQTAIYFDVVGFGLDESNHPTIKIGDGDAVTVSNTTDSHGNMIFKYKIPDGTVINQQTIITVTSRGNTYNFNWKDNAKNKLVIEANGNASVDEVYTEASGRVRTIYYDANFSALPYTNENDSTWLNYEIPQKSSGRITYYATANDNSTISGNMTATSYIVSERGQVYGNVYKVELPEKYTKISFANFNMISATNFGAHGESTGQLTIPSDMTNPCFYADTSDKIVYYNSSTNQRGGYWAKLGTVRNPETEAKIKYGDDTEVVDIPTGTFTRDKDVYYVDTTFYDYYSDYEHNGDNRDYYDDVGSTHRKYQQFRQFNQALSDYYSSTGALSPIYWGNFQNYNGSHFDQVANTMNLYGSSDRRKLFFENNSMWDSNGNELAESEGKNATQNLVNSTLQNGQLVYNTASGTAVVPYLDKSFLEGNNSKNSVLGKVYENVTFPFHKAQMKSRSVTSNGTVGYWYFNGTPKKESDGYPTSRNLRLTKDNTSGSYYLNETDSQVNGQNAKNEDMGKNFFPFNEGGPNGEGNQSKNSSKLNYGFAMKMQFDFTLTNDGTVKTSAKEDVPIEFNFAGDDDVWIFIDGKLALDIGGDHGMVEGRLNFRDLQYYISSVKNTTGGGASDKTGSFTIEGEKSDQHTLTMYYMERGLWESNLFLSFNFPDHNYMDVEKEVDTQDIATPLFDDYIANVKALDFNFEIKNFATHFSALAATGTTPSTGFVVKQYAIPDYGSIALPGLIAPEKAKYRKYTGSGDTKGEEQSIGSDGIFKLQDGQRASFMDQFRRGSYLALKEIYPVGYENIFDTEWTMFENGAPVTDMGTGTKVTNGSVTSMAGVQSLEVDDGRTEAYITGWEESQQIENSSYTEPKKPDGSTFVFRSYTTPDISAKETRLLAKYINKVKVGKLTVKKATATGSDPLTGTYNFTVILKNPLFAVNTTDAELADRHAKKVTFSLQADQENTITGIPYGTTFTIVEATPTDGSTLESVTFSKPSVTPEDLDDITNISGVIGTDNDDLTYQFNNTLQPPKTKIGITKVDADDSHTLGDVEFKLEKLLNDGTVDTSFTALTYTTNNEGEIETAELDNGTYQLTETKTQAGYQLLAKPIKIEIDRSAGAKSKVDGKEVSVTNDKIAITVANIKKFTLPSTGGRGRTIIVLTGTLLMWLAGLLYTLSKQKNQNY